MVRIHVHMRGRKEPLKRVPVELLLDASGERLEQLTDRNGIAQFELAPTSGKVVVSGQTRFHGRLDGDVKIELWSLTESASIREQGAPGGSKGGSTAYPGMLTKTLRVGDREVTTDSEGYLVDLDDWSEDFVRAQGAAEGLTLTAEHWEIVRYLRDYYENKHHQAPMRDIVRHFKKLWGEDKGNNHYLHAIFPRGGPQKQGNRLAGLLRTKGEH